MMIATDKMLCCAAAAGSGIFSMMLDFPNVVYWNLCFTVPLILVTANEPKQA